MSRDSRSRRCLDLICVADTPLDSVDESPRENACSPGSAPHANAPRSGKAADGSFYAALRSPREATVATRSDAGRHEERRVETS
jgi:hypothetical protein